MVFWRTYNNYLYPLGEVAKLGFPLEDPYFIPDEYLDKKEFIILRTCFGLGDWGIISSFPRKLKEKYPDCKVYIPSPILLKRMFRGLERNWPSWSDPFQVVHYIFDNNPYIDGFIDSFENEVYNDHYRIYDGDKDEPLMVQLLRFWKINSFDNIEPELFWTPEEHQIADDIIKQHSDGKFGTLLISNRWENEDSNKIQSILDKFNLPIFYWESKEVGLTYSKSYNLSQTDARIQLLIKSKAQFNVGNQSGVNDTIANYSPTYTIPRGKLGSNLIKSQIYI